MLRTRYADDAAARMVANALSVDPEVCDPLQPATFAYQHRLCFGFAFLPAV